MVGSAIVQSPRGSQAMREAMAAFRLGRRCYEARQFRLARSWAAEYREKRDCKEFNRQDRRPRLSQPPLWSVVIVSCGTGKELLNCLDSIYAQEEQDLEVILVDNGKNEAILQDLKKYPLLYVAPPQNMLASEGRNIGADFARGRYLAFVDDDGLVSERYLKEGARALAQPDVVGVRGRVVPKTPGGASSPHYDLGPKPKRSALNLEGNLVMRRDVFLKVGGFDPLMFGHEGKELGDRLDRLCRGGRRIYWPGLELKHDYAVSARLEAKRERQATGASYLEFLAKCEESVGKSTTAWEQVGSSLVIYSDVDISHSFAKVMERFDQRINQVVWVCREPASFLDGFAHLSACTKTVLVKAFDAGKADLASVLSKVVYDRCCLARMTGWEHESPLDHTDFIASCLERSLAPGVDKKSIKGVPSEGGPYIDFSDYTAIAPGRGGGFSGRKLDLPEPVGATAAGAEHVLVSIVVPLFNVEGYLADCLDSLLAQTYKNIEVIGVDDGSSDRSAEIFREYQSWNGHFKLVTHKKSIGPGGARNSGIVEAKGRYLLFVDADDWISPHAVETLVAVALEDDVDITFGGVLKYYEKNSSFVVPDNHGKCMRSPRRRTTIGESPVLFNSVVSWNKLIKKAYITDNNLLFRETPKRYEDMLTYMWYLSGASVSFIPNVTYFYRQRAGGESITQERSVESLIDKITAFFGIVSFSLKKGVFDTNLDPMNSKYAMMSLPRALRRVVPPLVKMCYGLDRSGSGGDADRAVNALRDLFSVLPNEYVEKNDLYIRSLRDVVLAETSANIGDRLTSVCAAIKA